MTLTYANVGERLRDDVPGFGPVYAEHIADYDEVLPHLLAFDLVKFLEHDFEVNGAETEAQKRAIAVVEEAMGSEELLLQNLVLVSFLESLDQEHPNLPTLRKLFGPRLTEEFKDYDLSSPQQG